MLIQYVLLQIHVSPVAVRLIKHRSVPGPTSVNLLRDFQKFLVLFRHRTMPDQALYSARTVAVEIVRFMF